VVRGGGGKCDCEGVVGGRGDGVRGEGSWKVVVVRGGVVGKEWRRKCW